MTTAKYIKYNALSFSTLKNINICGAFNKHQKQQPTTNTMKIGNIFEDVLLSTIGQHKQFNKRYYLYDGNFPKETPEIYNQIKNHDFMMENHIRYTKSGDIYKSDLIKFNLLTHMAEYFPRYPVSIQDYNNLKQMANNLLELEISIFDEKIPIVNLLQSDNAQFQVPLYWENNGIEKKALLDFMTIIKIDGKDFAIAIDFKTVGNIFGWQYELKKTYYLQDRHYIEGLKFCYPKLEVYPIMPFACVQNQAPFLVQENKLDYDENILLTADLAYISALTRWEQWQDNGRDESPVLESTNVKVWI